MQYKSLSLIAMRFALTFSIIRFNISCLFANDFGMRNILIVGVGGFLGSVIRYKLGGLVLHHAFDWKFPISTFVVNVTGCLIAGVLAGLVEKHDFFTAEIRLLLFTGILGGFTTFSAFGVETVFLIQRHDYLVATANVILSVAAGLMALGIGIRIAG